MIPRASAVILGACLLVASATASATAANGKERSYLVGFYDAKPACYRSPSGEPAGIFVDVARTIAAARGWTLTFVYDTWDGLLDRLRSGRVDFVPAIVRTPAREAFAVFTEEPVMTDWGVVYIHREGQIRTVLDLGGRRVGALENDFWFSGGGSLRDLATSFGLEPEYRYYPDYSALFVALGEGEVEAAAASNSLGIIWEPLLPIMASPIVYNPIELRFASPRSSPAGTALAGEMDRGLRELRAREPERLRQILAAYQVPERKIYRTPLWVTAALAALSAVLAAIVAALVLQSRALRRSVQETRRTAESLASARTELERGLEQKRLLVHELAHRVKNNLQLVLSLMGLVSGEGGPGGERGGTLGELREKVFALALAEEELFESGGVGQVSMESLASAILDRVATAEGAPRSGLVSRVEMGGGSIEASAVTPFSLIASELATNACRYGRSADGALRASLTVRTTEGGGGEIAMCDAGRGFPAGFDPSAAGGLGFRLVAALVAQMDAVLEVGSSEAGGARVAILVPPPSWSAPGAAS